MWKFTIRRNFGIAKSYKKGWEKAIKEYKVEETSTNKREDAYQLLY